MASKKKFPRTRRCNNSESVNEYCYCPLNAHYHQRRTIEDVPDRFKRYSDGTDKSDCAFSSLPSGDPELKLKDARDDPASSKSASNERKPIKGPEFDSLDVLVGISSILFFYADVVTDVLLARDYYVTKFYTEFGVTAGFVIVPSLATCFLNFRWYLLDWESQRILVKNRGADNVKQTSTLLWIVRFLMTVLMMGPVIRQIEYIYNGIKSNSSQLSDADKRRHYQVMRMEDVDACCIRMFECFLESAPQLLLQIYILMTHSHDENLLTDIIRTAAILSSWISLSWSLVAYQRALRLSHEDKENMTIPGTIFYFLWRAFEIGPRVIAFGLCASLFPIGFFVIIGSHWVFMSSWLFCQKTKFYQNRCEEKCFNIVCGLVLVFCFLNVRDGLTRYRMIIYYIIVYAENWTMMGFWFYFTEDKSRWFYLPSIFTVTLGVVVQLFFQLTYYRCFHPLGRGKIPCCPAQGNYTCYKSLCHDLEGDEEEQYYAQNTTETIRV